VSNSIPASALVNVVPSVVSAGGAGLALTGLFLTASSRVPMGAVLGFPSASAVGSYFGPSSTEAANAAVYFAGFQGDTMQPGNMLFAQYNQAAVAAYLRGGNVGALGLAAVKTITGTVILTVNGTLCTSSSINLSAATSFSNAATIIQAAFTTPPFTVSYDSVSGGFVFTSSTTGTGSTITAATGTASAALLLTVATGAVLSQGAAAQASPGSFMDGIINTTTNWASFTTLFDPDGGSGNTTKLAFATWNGEQNNRYAYVACDNDATAANTEDASGSLGRLLAAGSISGTILVWTAGLLKASFVCGWAASLNFEQPNGRATLAFKSQSGLMPDVTDATTAANLEANGYNYYGAWATADQQFIGMYPGSVSGLFLWADSYMNQIWMNSGFQSQCMALLFQTNAVPYTPAGLGLIRSALTTIIQSALAFGVFQPNVVLSSAQINEVNYAAGANIAPYLQANGYYLQILPPPATARTTRTSPIINFWYMDGGSVQKINIASIEVQ
jgi:Protein of unknown function (DUF3383)